MTRQAKPPGADAVDAEARRVLHRWQVTRPDDRLAHLVKDTLRLLDRSLRTRLARFGVSIGHWPFLRALWERDGLTQRELSREVGVMDPTTFAAVRSMEALGYVVRRPVPGDRRKRDVFLTAQGRALEARLVPLAREINSDGGPRRASSGRRGHPPHAGRHARKPGRRRSRNGHAEAPVPGLTERPIVSRLPLTLACWNYDRTRALADGSVRPDGIDLEYFGLDVEETFFRMLRHREFDVAEMSLSSYAMTVDRGDSPFVAIPVFPSRMFRHGCIFVSAKSGIREARALAGRRIGVPEYQMTAPVWIRGILHDEYGVDPTSVEYVTGGVEQAGREEKLKLDLPPTFRVTPIGAAQTLAQMLADGEIDALYTARAPSTLATRPRHRAAPVRRLRRGRAGVLQKDADLPDHAHDRDPP